MTGVLTGVRVLDFGRYIAGPFCAALLGDMGAEVIRIERLDGGEDRYSATIGERGTGALYVAMNRNKRGITLNPTKPAGRKIVQQLVSGADVVVANLTLEVLTQLGLDYASLKAIKPDIILTTVTAFGPNGPYSQRVGFDGVAQAMSGNMHLSGYASEPMKAYVPYVDFMTASLTAFGTMAALMERQRSGQGQVVEGALLLSAMAIANSTLVEEAVTGVNRVASGNRGQTSAPSDCFKTRDGWLLVSVVGDAMFARWAKLVGVESWLTDARFKNDDTRGLHSEMISAHMAAWCEGRSSGDVMAALDGARIPCGEVLAPRETLANAHVQATGFVHAQDYPGVDRPVPIVGTPVLLSQTPGSLRRRAPLLGEHTDEVLQELGYDPAAVAALRADRIV